MKLDLNYSLAMILLSPRKIPEKHTTAICFAGWWMRDRIRLTYQPVIGYTLTPNRENALLRLLNKNC